MIALGNDWDELLAKEWQKDYYLALRQFLKQEYRTQVIYPDMHDIYAALRLTPCADTKVVILGQDPYHGPNQAHGLCFSVQKGIVPPPSLKNIYKELEHDLGITPPSHGNLIEWAQRGVLLLNATLTVRQGLPASHKGKGWERFTDEIIRILNAQNHPIAFLLWGANARAKKAFITNPIHGIFESAHPSPLSAYNGFFGSRPFSRINQFLEKNQLSPIDWRITD